MPHWPFKLHVGFGFCVDQIGRVSVMPSVSSVSIRTPAGHLTPDEGLRVLRAILGQQEERLTGRIWDDVSTSHDCCAKPSFPQYQRPELFICTCSCTGVCCWRRAPILQQGQRVTQWSLTCKGQHFYFFSSQRGTNQSWILRLGR